MKLVGRQRKSIVVVCVPTTGCRHVDFHWPAIGSLRPASATKHPVISGSSSSVTSTYQASPLDNWIVISLMFSMCMVFVNTSMFGVPTRGDPVWTLSCHSTISPVDSLSPMWLYSPSLFQTTGSSHAASAFRSHSKSRPRTAIDRYARSTQSPSVAIFSARDCTTPRSPTPMNTPSCSTLKSSVYWTFKATTYRPSSSLWPAWHSSSVRRGAASHAAPPSAWTSLGALVYGVWSTRLSVCLIVQLHATAS